MKLKRRHISLLTLLLVSVLTFALPITSFATGTAGSNLQQTFISGVCSGKVSVTGTNNDTLSDIDYSTNVYPTTSGGYIAYATLCDSTSVSRPIKESVYNQLSDKGKREFLEDFFKVANTINQGCQNGYSVTTNSTIVSGVSDTNMDNLVAAIQPVVGEGTTLLTTILNDAQPDWNRANRILTPFKGIIGTATALLAVAMMALLGLHMALDICYIVLPSVQLICGGGDGTGGAQGGSGKSGNTLGGLVSQAAKDAVNSKDSGQGGGENKNAIFYYLKKRIVDLILIGICLLYLVSGNLWTGVARILDLLQGALGF